MDKNTSREDDRGDIRWCYADIMENGSEELKSIITFITADHPPGIPHKEEKTNE